MTQTMIDKEMIVSVLREMGVRAGDSIALHSSVPSLGRVLVKIQKERGIEAVKEAVNDVIDAFVMAVDPDEGLVMVPTFSYCFKGRSETGVYHPDKAPSKVGMLTEIFRQRSDAHRSLQPTHSVCAIGKGAEEIIKGHEDCTPLGVDSPFHRLAKRGGWACFLGTNSATLSLLHVAETIAAVPQVNTFCYEKDGWEQAAEVEDGDRGVKEVPLKDIPGCSENFGVFDEWLAQEEMTVKGKIYKSHVKLFRADEALDLAVRKLKEEPFALMCAKGKCPDCDVRWKAHGF